MSTTHTTRCDAFLPSIDAPPTNAMQCEGTAEYEVLGAKGEFHDCRKVCLYHARHIKAAGAFGAMSRMEAVNV